MLRYIIERVKLAKNHPLWPDEYVYKIVDTMVNYWPYTCYATMQAAEDRLAKKIERLEKISSRLVLKTR